MEKHIHTHDMPAIDELKNASRDTIYHIGMTPTDYEDIQIWCDGEKGINVSFIHYAVSGSAIDMMEKFNVEIEDCQLDNYYEASIYDFMETLEWAEEEKELVWDDISDQLAERIDIEEQREYAEYMEDLRFARSLDYK